MSETLWTAAEAAAAIGGEARGDWSVTGANFDTRDLQLGDLFVAIVGPNGIGKTNLLEAIGLLATLKSFRGAPTESLIRRGAERSLNRMLELS